MLTRVYRILAVSLAVAGLLGLSDRALANSSGAPGLTSGGAFPGETSCSRCHNTSEVNEGTGTLELLVNGAPASEYFYVPGETATLGIQFADASAVRIGFQLAARSGSGCMQGGTLAATDTPAGESVRINDGPCGDGTGNVQWATQRRPRTGMETLYEIAWTAPDAMAGPVTVAVAVNGANGDLSPRDDSIYTASAVLMPLLQPTGPPVLTEGSVVLADMSSNSAVTVPGSVVTAAGSEFTGQGKMFDAMLDENGMLMTTLDGACVQVNQVKAPLLHLTDSTVMFEVPADTAVGMAQVQFVRGCDTPEAVVSNALTVQVAAARPVLFTHGADPASAAALHVDGALVGVPESVAGHESRPARPGDVVTLFGTGFGPVSPALGTGEISTTPRSLAANMFSASIGTLQLPATDLLYAGLTPYSTGLYQVTMRIPEAAPEGSHVASINVDGLVSPLGPMIEIGAAMNEEPQIACMVELVVPAGSSCLANVFGFEVEFSVDETGKACVSLINLCSETALDLTLYGAGVTRNDDGSWTVDKLP